MSESAYARQRRDERIAEEATSTDTRGLMCKADFCPNRWSVDGGLGKCCSAHAWAPAHCWPHITREQQDAETERAFRAANPRPPAPQMTWPQRKAAMQALRVALSGANKPDPKAWAHNLRSYELEHNGMLPSGLPMTQFQRDAWRVVLLRVGEVVPVLEGEEAAAEWVDVVDGDLSARAFADEGLTA